MIREHGLKHVGSQGPPLHSPGGTSGTSSPCSPRRAGQLLLAYKLPGGKKDGHWPPLCPVNSAFTVTLGPEGEGPQLPAPAGFWGPHSPSPRGKRGTGIRVWLTPPFIPIPRTPPDGQIAPSAGDSQRGFPAPLGRAVGSPQPSPSPLHGARPALGWIRTLSAKGPKAEMLRSRLHPPTAPPVIT